MPAWERLLLQSESSGRLAPPTPHRELPCLIFESSSMSGRGTPEAAPSQAPRKTEEQGPTPLRGSGYARPAGFDEDCGHS